ncbi:MAG: muramoyltetrapeptide carboxypeptidase [Polyangiales bacterium]
MRRVLRLIAPSGPIAEDDFLSGLAFLREHFEVRYRDDILTRQSFLAGSDARRLEEIREALADEEAVAIVAVRGGHGALRIVDKLDLDIVRRASKPIVGFSDVTALHLAWARAGVPSLHASMVGALGRDASIRSEWLSSVDKLVTQQPQSRLTGLDVWRSGSAKGRLLGGNLRVLASLLGTPYVPSFENAVLLLEDVGEHAYRIDRLLTTLRLHGVFDQVSAVVLGEFHQCAPSEAQSCEAVLRDFFADAHFPVLAGLPIGHGSRNIAAQLNVDVEVHGGELRYVL